MIKTVQLFFVSLLFTIFYLLFTIPVFAQTTAPTPNTNPDVPKNLHTYTQNVMIEVMAAMTCQLTGIDPVNPSQQCLGIDSASKKIGFVDLPSSAAGSGQAGGAIGLMGNLIAATYTPPFHTGDYFNYLAQNFGIAKPAYAQGVGFTGLNPILNIWSAFRDIVYLLFVVVFVVIGLAIMLRLHIDPRTVMTIENQIPKIIIGLVMVTFSFAIAGFLIDMMYVSIYAVNGVIKDIPNGGAEAAAQFDPAKLQGVSPFGAVEGLGGINKIVNTSAISIRTTIQSLLGIEICTDVLNCFNDLFNPFRIATDFVVKPTVSIASFFINLVSLASAGGLFFKVASIQTPAFTTPVIGDILNAVIGGGKYAAATGVALSAHAGTQFLLRDAVPFLIAYLVIFIAVLWALFRLWFQLIIAYIYILIDVVFAPFWILAGLFPGSSIGFGAWLRDIVANLSSFPVAIAMFMLGKVFMSAFSNNKDAFVPPLIGGVGGTELIGSLIGIGIILMTPQVVTMMRDLLKAPGFKYAAAIGQAVGVGAGAGKGIATTTSIGVFGASKPGDKGLGAVMRRFVGI